MPGRHPNAMRQPDKRAYPLLQDAIDGGWVGNRQPYPVENFNTHDAANAGRKSVLKAGRHFNVSVSAWVTDASGENCYRQCKNPDAPHGIRFMLFSKNEGRAYIAGIAEGDPGKLKYNPFAKRAAKLDDDGHATA
jgi:hypothetical protein